MFNDAQQKIIDAIVEFRRGVYERYDQAVTDWYYDSDTKHLSFPTCIHGTDRWTDYDNICPGCENGEDYWDEDRERANAEDMVKRAVQHPQETRSGYPGSGGRGKGHQQLALPRGLCPHHGMV